jgi:hypothetical protein
MPIFRTTTDIFKDSTEYFDPNWMDSKTIQLPPNKKWDYKRELQIEDVNIWEVLYEEGAGVQLYASWDPYAEFYLLVPKMNARTEIKGIEVYYGKGAQKQVQKRIKELGIRLDPTPHWVEDDEMWLYA